MGGEALTSDGRLYVPTTLHIPTPGGSRLRRVGGSSPMTDGGRPLTTDDGTTDTHTPLAGPEGPTTTLPTRTKSQLKTPRPQGVPVFTLPCTKAVPTDETPSATDGKDGTTSPTKHYIIK